MKEIVVVYGTEGQVDCRIVEDIQGISHIVVHGWTSEVQNIEREKMRYVFESLNSGILPENSEKKYLEQLSIGRALQECFQEQYLQGSERAREIVYLVHRSRIEELPDFRQEFQEKFKQSNYFYQYSSTFVLGKWKGDVELDSQLCVVSGQASKILTAYPGLVEMGFQQFCILRGIRMVEI